MEGITSKLVVTCLLTQVIFPTVWGKSGEIVIIGGGGNGKSGEPMVLNGSDKKGSGGSTIIILPQALRGHNQDHGETRGHSFGPRPMHMHMPYHGMYANGDVNYGGYGGGGIGYHMEATDGYGNPDMMPLDIPIDMPMEMMLPPGKMKGKMRHLKTSHSKKPMNMRMSMRIPMGTLPPKSIKKSASKKKSRKVSYKQPIFTFNPELPPIIVKIPTPMITVPTPIINIPTPIVNVSSPYINMPAPHVTVPQPIVNVPAPNVNVAAPVIHKHFDYIPHDTPEEYHYQEPHEYSYDTSPKEPQFGTNKEGQKFFEELPPFPYFDMDMNQIPKTFQNNLASEEAEFPPSNPYFNKPMMALMKVMQGSAGTQKHRPPPFHDKQVMSPETGYQKSQEPVSNINKKLIMQFLNQLKQTKHNFGQSPVTPVYPNNAGSPAIEAAPSPHMLVDDIRNPNIIFEKEAESSSYSPPLSPLPSPPHPFFQHPQHPEHRQHLPQSHNQYKQPQLQSKKGEEGVGIIFQHISPPTARQSDSPGVNISDDQDDMMLYQDQMKIPTIVSPDDSPSSAEKDVSAVGYRDFEGTLWQPIGRHSSDYGSPEINLWRRGPSKRL